tara:strand:- start:414 stop:581 length:168 start_codon:yes stop_codon:yes gene_type:complete
VGKLLGFKVGNFWRFLRADIEVSIHRKMAEVGAESVNAAEFVRAKAVFMEAQYEK